MSGDPKINFDDSRHAAQRPSPGPGPQRAFDPLLEAGRGFPCEHGAITPLTANNAGAMSGRNE